MLSISKCFIRQNYLSAQQGPDLLVHVTQEVDVAEVGTRAVRPTTLTGSSAVLTQVVSEKHVQFVPLPHSDQAHVPRPLVPKRLHHVSQAAGQRRVAAQIRNVSYKKTDYRETGLNIVSILARSVSIWPADCTP